MPAVGRRQEQRLNAANATIFVAAAALFAPITLILGEVCTEGGRSVHNRTFPVVGSVSMYGSVSRVVAGALRRLILETPLGS